MKNNKIYNSRKRSNFIGLSLSMAAMTLGMVVLTWILFVLVSKGDRKSTRLNSSHPSRSRMPSSA